MKKYLLLAILLLLIPLVVYSWAGVMFMSGRVVASGGCVYVHCNGLEAQADDDDWTTVDGTPDYDYSTTGLSLELSECLALDATESTQISITERAETWISFMFRINEDIESDEDVVYLYDSSNNLLAYVKYMYSGNDFQATVYGGSSNQMYSSPTAEGATVYLKMRYKQGTGANAEFEVWAGTDGTNWDDTSGNLSDGSRTNQFHHVKIKNNTDAEIMYVDWFLENSSDIADCSP